MLSWRNTCLDVVHCCCSAEAITHLPCADGLACRRQVTGENRAAVLKGIVFPSVVTPLQLQSGTNFFYIHTWYCCKVCLFGCLLCLVVGLGFRQVCFLSKLHGLPTRTFKVESLCHCGCINERYYLPFPGTCPLSSPEFGCSCFAPFLLQHQPLPLPPPPVHTCTQQRHLTGPGHALAQLLKCALACNTSREMARVHSYTQAHKQTDIHKLKHACLQTHGLHTHSKCILST